MGLGSFLKVAGKVVATSAQIATGLNIAAPILSAFSPQAGAAVNIATSELTQLKNLVVLGESFGQNSGLDGPAKAKAISGAVAQLFLQSTSFMQGMKVKDQPAFLSACERAGGAIADILNSMEHTSTPSLPTT